MVSAFCWKLVYLFWAFAGGGFSCKTGQNAVRFCFLFFAWVRSVLGSCPKKGTENRTERTLGCSGWNSAPLFLWFLLVRMDNQEQRGFALVLRLAFMGSLFLRVRFCIINSGKQTGLVVRNVRFWLVSPGFSSSFLSSSSSPVACRRNRRLLLLFQRLDDASSPPPLPEGSSPQIVWLLFGFLSFLSPLPC